MTEEPETAIKPAVNRLLPIADPEQAKEAYQAYLKLCQSVLIPFDERIVDADGVVRQESDYARISQRKKVEGRWITEYVDAPRKSAWRKLARFYGVSTEILDKQRTVDEDGMVTWHYSVRAWQRDVTTTGEAACSTTERGGKERTEHEAKSTSHTRAKNRAISDLIGFGQVSAEEMTPSSPRKQVEAEVKIKQKKTKKKTKKKNTKKEKKDEDEGFTPAEPPETKPQTTLKPEVKEIEEKVLATLEANGVDTKHLLILKYGDTVHIQVQEDYDQIGWIDDQKVITKLLNGVWVPEHERWEVPPP